MANVDHHQTEQQQQTQCDYDYDDFTYIPSMVFKTIGYDFLLSRKPLWQHLLLSGYFLLCFISNAYISFYMILRILQWDTLSGNPALIMRYAIMFFFMLNSDVKFVAFVLNRRRLRLLNLALKRLYPLERAKRIDYNVNKYYWSKLALYALSVYYFSVLLVLLGPITQSTISYLLEWSRVGKDEATFLYLRAFPMELGFNTMKPLGYAISFIVDAAFSHYIMNVNLGTDLWLACLAGQIAMHFSYTAKKLAEYSPNCANEREDCQFLSEIANLHQVMLNLHRELNHIFGLLLAYNLLTTASTLCCIAFYTVVQGFNREGISFLLFFFTTSAQFYMVCHYGQLLIDSSQSIAIASYTNNWYDRTPSYKKYLLFIIMRAQRPAELSARDIIIISLDTFKSLLNITFRFFAVVRTVLSKE